MSSLYQLTNYDSSTSFLHVLRRFTLENARTYFSAHHKYKIPCFSNMDQWVISIRCAWERKRPRRERKNETTDKGTWERCKQKIFKKLESHVERVESLVPTKTKNSFFPFSFFPFAHVWQRKKIKFLQECIFIHIFRMGRAHLFHLIFLFFLFEKKKWLSNQIRNKKSLEKVRILLKFIPWTWNFLERRILLCNGSCQTFPLCCLPKPDFRLPYLLLDEQSHWRIENKWIF